MLCGIPVKIKSNLCKIRRISINPIMVAQSSVQSLNKKPYNVDLETFFFVALRPKSTAMVMAGWSVQLTTLFPWQA